MNENPSPTGLVLNAKANFYTVKVGEAAYQCVLKGILKKEGTDVLVGDRVEVDSLDTVNQSGRIVRVLPRDNQLTRPKVANVTCALIVMSIKSPPLDPIQLDRYIANVLLAGLKAVICLSKVDLLEDRKELQAVKAIYERLSIPVYVTSIKDPDSVAELFETIQHETVVLAGQSGVGKSSLLNVYRPELDLKVGEVSEKAERGQHTTRHVSLIAIGEDTYVADTPGFSYLKFDTVTPEELEAHFPDFDPWRPHCRFPDCLHVDEEGCMVRQAVEQGEISLSRYASYLAFQQEAQAYRDMLQTTSQKEEFGYKTLMKGKKEKLQVLKLHGKHREESRRTTKQRIHDWTEDDASDQEE